MQATPTTSTDAMLTKEQLASRLNLPSTRMVDELMRKRRIPFIRLGHRTIRFDFDRVMEALARLEVQAVGDAKADRNKKNIG